MANVAGGGARPNRRATPSANELLRSLTAFGTEFMGAPVAASKAQANSIRDIMDDSSQSMDFYAPTEYNNLAGELAKFDPHFTTRSRPFYEVIDMNIDLDRQSNLRVPGEQPDEEEDASPADITLVPTSTTNPSRPRTVAAGYDEDEMKLTVVFRDGTFYNYYEVDKNEWAAFKANRSKGAIIAQMLDFHPRGPADMSTFSQKAQAAFYRYSRGFQIQKQGRAVGQTKATYKTIEQRARGTKQTGKNTSKGGRAPKGR